MNQINPNFNNFDLNKNQIQFKADENPYAVPNFQLPQAQQIQDVQVPDIYYVPDSFEKPQGFKDKLKKVDLFGLVSPWFEHPLLMIGTCAGLSYGVNLFDKSCNRNYEKSILGKAAKLGDKIEKSKIIQSDASQSVLKGIGKVWNGIKTTAMKNSVINAMVTTPSSPEYSFPKDELKHTESRVVNKFKELATELNIFPKDSGGGIFKGLTKMFRRSEGLNVKDLDLNKSEIENLRKIYKVKNLSQAPQEELVNRVMLQRLGKSESEISSIISGANASKTVTQELIKKTGLTTEELDMILKDKDGKTVKLVKKASKNLENIKLNKGMFKVPGSYQPFSNITGFSEIYNKLHSLSDGAETKTGRFFARFLQKVHRGFTFGGTKLGVLIWIAPMLVETILNTKKADPKEKVGTFTQGVINFGSWVFTFPLILRAIHAYGGAQYAGMGKDKVEEYKKLIENFNAKVDSKGFKDFAEYKTEKKALKKQLKSMRKVQSESLLTAMIRSISRFSKADLLKIKSYRQGTAIQNFIRKMPNFLKDAAYSPARFIIFMFVGLQFADKIITKCTSKIFGNAYDAMKEEEFEEAKKKQEEYTIKDLKARMVEAQRNKLYPPIQNEIVQNNINPANETTDSPNGLTDEQKAMMDEIQAEYNSSYNTQNINTNNDLPLDKDNSNAQAVKIPANPYEKENSKIDQLNDNDTIPMVNNANSVMNNQNLNRPHSNISQTDTNVNNRTSKKYDRRERDNYTYVPSSENVLNKDKSENSINKYVPSQVGAKFDKTFDNSGLDKAMRRADYAEQRALNVLAGNFGEG